MDDYSKVYIRLNDYISGVKELKDLDPVLKDITRYNEHDVFTRIKNSIVIADDWIKYAEERMKYVEAAVFENRQFIREEGEVLPIERVRKISRSSVEDLSRHSDYIEKITEDGEVVPEKLYTVNKDTDYGVYENKFLYLLLVTFSDFITRVKDDIEELLKRTNGELAFERRNAFLHDEVTLSVKMTFAAKDMDAFSEAEKKKLFRMDELKSQVGSLLLTPLMQVVGKEPMISSTITKTNVLTMNENFSHSLELYEYLLNYDKEGFHTESTSESLAFRNEFAFPVLALELLAEGYKESLIEAFRKDQFDYESEVRERKIEELNVRLSSAKNDNGDPAAYIVTLEDKIKLLTDQNGEIRVLRAQITDLDSAKRIALSENEELKERIAEFEEAVKELTSKIGRLSDSKNDETIAFEKKLAEKEDEISSLRQSLKDMKAKLGEAEFEKTEALLREESLKKDRQILEKEKDVLMDTYEKRLAEKDNEYAAGMEELGLMKSRLTAIQAEAGEILAKDADASEDAFNELETEYNAFTKYYEEVWKKCKKEILKEIKSKRKKG